MNKYFLLFITLIASVCTAQTPNIQLQLPPTGSTNWGIPLNYNFNKLDLMLSGNLAIPALTVSGALNAPNFVFSNSQILAALGYTPLNKAGDIMTGPLSIGTPLPAGITGLYANSVQSELNGASFASFLASGLCAAHDAPCLAVQAACAAGTNAVYFPAGTYPTNGIPVCSSLHLHCPASNIVGAGGTTFVVTGSNWGLYNPQADVAIGSNGVYNIRVEGCTWDISQDPLHVLGAWKIKGILSSTFQSNTIVAKNNAYPAITEDGANYAHNNGNYDNDFISNTLWDLSHYDASHPSDSPGGSRGIGIYITSCSIFTGCAGQVVGGGNDNHHWGGGIARFGYGIYIDGGGNNSFTSIDGENFAQNCAYLSNATGRSSQNKFQKIRCETNIAPWSSGTKSKGAIILDSNNNNQVVTTAGTTGGSQPTWSTTLGGTTTDGGVTWTLSSLQPSIVYATGTFSNSFDMYASGYTIPIIDDTQMNTYAPGSTFAASLLPGNPNLVGGQFAAASTGWGYWGFNKQPWMADNNQFSGGLDVHGGIQSDHEILLCQFNNGCYTKNAQASWTTGGAGVGAVVVVTGVANGQITTIKLRNIGTGFAVNDVLTLTQIASSGLGATVHVDSVDGSGGILTWTITNGGNGGFAHLRFTGIGNQVFTFPATGGTLMTTGGTTTSIITSPTNTATSGANYASYVLGASSSYWNGTSAAVDQMYCYNAPGVGTNPNVVYLCTAAGSPGTHTWQFNNIGMFYYNSVPATAGANSPVAPTTYEGGYWTGTVNANDIWTLTHTLPTGANPFSSMKWTHSGSSGGAALDLPALIFAGDATKKATAFTSTAAQIVTCPAGGTSLQYCGPDGAWHTVSVPAGSQVATVPSALYTGTVASGFATIYTTTAAGQYRICGQLSVVTTGTGAANWQVYAKITTDGTVTTPAIGSLLANTGAAGSLNVGSGNGNCPSYYIDNGTNIQYSLTPTATTTTTNLRYGLKVFYDGP